MDAENAVKELLQVSEDVRAAVLFERGGQPLATTLPDDETLEVAALGDAMLAYADTLRETASVRHLEAVTPEGDVYVMRDGERAVVAVAARGSLAGLVQHDLKTLLAGLSRRKRKGRAHAVS